MISWWPLFTSYTPFSWCLQEQESFSKKRYTDRFWKYSSIVIVFQRIFGMSRDKLCARIYHSHILIGSHTPSNDVADYSKHECVHGDVLGRALSRDYGWYACAVLHRTPSSGYWSIRWTYRDIASWGMKFLLNADMPNATAVYCNLSVVDAFPSRKASHLHINSQTPRKRQCCFMSRRLAILGANLCCDIGRTADSYESVALQVPLAIGIDQA